MDRHILQDNLYLALPGGFSAVHEEVHTASHVLSPVISSQNDPAVACQDAHKCSRFPIPPRRDLVTIDRDVQISPFVFALPFGGWSNRGGFLRIALVLTSLPYAAATPDTSHFVRSDKSTTVLFVFMFLGILFACASYFAEIKKTFELPEDKPNLPICHPIDNGLSPYRRRNLALHTPAVVWLLLSVMTICMTGVFWRSADSKPLDWCSALNPDIAGVGSRVSLWVPGVIAMLTAVLGHYHAEETGVKSVNVSLLVAQIVYGWNLWTKKTTPVDQLIGAMILDCLIFLTSVTFSMKECLAARQLIRVGHFVQFFCLFVLFRVMMKFHDADSSPKVSDDSCPCFQAYWWGPFDSCSGASPTFWLYFILKCIAIAHNSWLCLWHMSYYDAAEKLGRNDQNTAVKDVEDTVYDSIPATAFTKYLEWIPIAVASIINIELTLKGSHLQGVQDSSSWGQTAQVLMAAVVVVCFSYGICSMFKAKAVERRQTALNRSSVGSMIPKFTLHRFNYWRPGDWIQDLTAIARDHHPFARLVLRSTDHSRMEYKQVAWRTIVNPFCQWPNESPRELGVRLVTEAKFGDLNVIQALLLEDASVTEVDIDGNTALHIAALEGHDRIVELLLAKTTDTSVQNNDGSTALHIAASEGHNEIVKLLLEKTTDTSIQKKDGNTALHIAALRGHDRMVELLLAKTTDTSIQDKGGSTALHDAALAGLSEVAKLLLAKTTDTSAQDDYGSTALHLAAQYGHEKMVELLLEKTTDTSIQDKDGNTVLHLAALRGGGKMVELLLAKTTDTSIQDKDGDTVLHIAALRGYEKMVELLLAKTTDTSIKNKGGWTALHGAASKGHNEIVNLLLAKTTDTSVQNDDGSTALHIAASEGHNEIVKLLLEKTTDTSIQDKDGRTALHIAAESGDEKMVELLLAKTTDTAIQDKGGNTALHLAALRGHEKMVELLLAKTTDTSIQDEYGDTVLHIAAESGDEKMVELLLAKTTDTSIQDKDGNTALHLAALGGHEKMVELLLAKTTDTSIQNNDGNTVLHIATLRGDDRMVELLLD